MPDDEGIRLQKALSQAGVASRRAGEVLISRGRVEVNGEVVKEQGRRVDPATDVIRVDGKRVPPQASHQYLVLNKPRGVLCAMQDTHGRRTIAEFVPEGVRLFHVGRLDSDTEGLLVLTNDGDFAQRLTHPSYEITKTYLAEVAGEISDATLKRLRGGIELEDGPIIPDEVRLVQRSGGRSLVRVVLHSGRNRIVRRIFDELGHPVERLSRLAIGPVKLGDLRIGDTRELTSDELGELLDLLGR